MRQVSNSPLVNYTKLSPNHSGTRTQPITRITPHCVVGQLSVERLGDLFQNTARQASCNYGIGSDGRVALIVDESKRSWCSSSSANDQRAVTIECASDAAAPYAFNDTVYNKLVDLCVDICRRNGKTKLLWIADKNAALNYKPASTEMLLTVHRWFANKSCPGDWMYARMGRLATDVTNKLKGGAEELPNIEDLTEQQCEALWAKITEPFRDNDASNYSSVAREWATCNGIIAGTGGATPNYEWQAPMTREQFVTMLYRFAQFLGKA